MPAGELWVPLQSIKYRNFRDFTAFLSHWHFIIVVWSFQSRRIDRIKTFELFIFTKGRIILFQLFQSLITEVNKSQNHHDLIISHFIGRKLLGRHSLIQTAAIWISSGHLLSIAYESKLYFCINIVHDIRFQTKWQIRKSEINVIKK